MTEDNPSTRGTRSTRPITSRMYQAAAELGRSRRRRPVFVNLQDLTAIDSRILTVGPPGSDGSSTSFGVSVDFTSINAALDAIPTLTPDDPNHSFVDRWTIVVMNGFYPEEIRCKPYVNIVGVNKESVYIQAPPGRDRERDDPRLANVYLSSLSLVSNVTLLSASDAMGDDVTVWGLDRYGNQRGDVYALGLSNVDLWPAPPCKLIRMEGNWHTAIFRDVGGNYTAPDGYGIELIGQFNGGNNQNADCHFSNCFFDALFMSGDGPGGLFWVQDCFEVHLRNSLVRVNYVPNPPSLEPIAAVKTNKNSPGWTHVSLEGTTLNGPGESTLDVGSGTVCWYKHSSSDSLLVTGDGLWLVDPDGIALDKRTFRP